VTHALLGNDHHHLLQGVPVIKRVLALALTEALVLAVKAVLHTTEDGRFTLARKVRTMSGGEMEFIIIVLADSAAKEVVWTDAVSQPSSLHTTLLQGRSTKGSSHS